MNPERDLATQPIAGEPRHAVGPDPALGPPAPAEDGDTSAVDPLAKITMQPRTFAAMLAIVALLLGLILALVPVHVAGPDPTAPRSISCGNTIGGVETTLLAEGLGDAATTTVMATYVGNCETAMSVRLAFSWPLFFAGMLAVFWFLVVRPASPPPRN